MALGNEDRKKYNLKIKELKAANSVLLSINREHKKQPCHKYPHEMQSLPSFIKTLSYHHHLKGHKGCVNCIEFSEDGRTLVSGSDDTKIILWDMTGLRQKAKLSTGHRGNIFTVKFLPKSADNYIVSGAGDNRIEMKNVSSGDTVSSCQCHVEGVKRIATLPLSSAVYFSASEDGTVRQFDRREKHSCSRQTNNVLVDLRHLSDVKLEAKCLAVNPIQTDMIAVGSTDAYIRVYDRRKLTLSSLETLSKRTDFNPLPVDCVQYFTPGHLPEKMAKFNNSLFKTLAVTYLTYSPNGTSLLANIGGDSIYLFDTINATVPKNYSIPAHPLGGRKHFTGSQISINSQVFQHEVNGSKDTISFEGLDHLFDDGCQCRDYPERVKNIIQLAESTPRPDDLIALELFNKAIDLWPYSCYLYLSRADVYMRRNWDGDWYAAVRDWEKALELDPTCQKALFRKIKYLHYAGKDQEALCAMESDSDIMTRLSANETHLIAMHEFLSKASSLQVRKEHPYGSLKGRKLETLSTDEQLYRSLAKDYEKAYSGHCNTTTDIKEVTFIGNDCEYLASGSDDGNIFIWERETTNLAHVIRADQSIVNCVQFHPSMCMMASSGIESVIKLWAPNKLRCETVTQMSSIVRENQLRMRQDPLEVMMFPINEFSIGSHILDIDPTNVRRLLSSSSSSDDEERGFSLGPTRDGCQQS